MAQIYRPAAAIRINPFTDTIVSSYGFDEASFTIIDAASRWSVAFAPSSLVGVLSMQVEVTSQGAQNRTFFGTSLLVGGEPGVLITVIDPTTGLTAQSFSPVLGMVWDVFGGLT